MERAVPCTEPEAPDSPQELGIMRSELFGRLEELDGHGLTLLESLHKVRNPPAVGEAVRRNCARFIHPTRPEARQLAFRFHSATPTMPTGRTSLPPSSPERAVDDFLFERFVRHHFAADLGETRESSLDVEKSIFIEPADVAGFEPAVAQHVRGPVFLDRADNSLENVLARAPARGCRADLVGRRRW